MENQIEKMAVDICPLYEEYGSCKKCDDELDIDDEPCLYKCMAKLCIKKGYRKQSEEGAECPTCRGTGRIGTTDWLTKNVSKQQLAEEKAKAIAEHEQYVKTEVAKEIFKEIRANFKENLDGKTSFFQALIRAINKTEKKYTEEVNDDGKTN